MAASSPSRKRALDEDGDAATSAAPSAKRVPTVNPLNGRPFSSTYHELREQRMKLPVSGFLDDLEKRLRTSQVVIVEGETGSGKTTQVSKAPALPLAAASRPRPKSQRSGAAWGEGAALAPPA